MDQSFQDWKGIPLGAPDSDDGLALPRDLNTKLWGYDEPPMPELEPFDKAKAKAGDGEIYRAVIRREPRFRETLKGKLLGIAVGTSMAGCASVPISHYMNNETAPAAGATAAGSAADASADDPAARALFESELQAKAAQIKSGESRGTVVLDLGHGTYHVERDGQSVAKPDRGAFHTRANGTVVEEANVTEAMGARMALQLIHRGFNVQFTRSVDLANNPHLQDLSGAERDVLAQFNSTRRDLPNRFDARIETARAAYQQDARTVYLVLHADSAGSDKARGGAISIHPDVQNNGASYRFGKSLQENFNSSSLGRNISRGIISGQSGRSPIYAGDCDPEIGLDKYRLSITTPNAAGSVKNGLGTIPTALFEMGFLSNASDVWRLTNDKWATNLATTTVDGIEQFFAREHEGVRAPTPTTITVNGKEARLLPEDPQASARVTAAMIAAIPPDRAATSTLITQPVTRCTPEGTRYTQRVAYLGTTRPANEPDTTVARGARTPIDHATRPEAERTRS